MDGVIQFIANYAGWTSVKKLKVTNETDPRTIMEFLASLGTGIDNKVEENLRKLVDLDSLDKIVEEETEKLGKNKDSVNEAVLIIKSAKVRKQIKEICELEELQKNEKKELEGFCTVYITRRILKEVGLQPDYSQIEIPGMKRLMRKKPK